MRYYMFADNDGQRHSFVEATSVDDAWGKLGEGLAKFSGALLSSSELKRIFTLLG